MVSHSDTLDPPNPSLTFAFCGILELKKSLVILEKAGKEKDFKTCAPLTKYFKQLRKSYHLADTILVVKYYLPDLYERL